MPVKVTLLLLGVISAITLTSNITNSDARPISNPSTFELQLCPDIEEEDGGPIMYCPETIKVSNGTLTDNGDGSASVNIGGNFKGVLASSPSSPEAGWTYINSIDHGYYIRYNDQWQLLHTLSVVDYFLLLETGDFLLLEDGASKLILE